MDWAVNAHGAFVMAEVLGGLGLLALLVAGILSLTVVGSPDRFAHVGAGLITLGLMFAGVGLIA